MALTFGQLASGAGAVGTGMRQAEEAERVARQNQLRIEEQNRANQAAQEIQAARAGLQVPAMPNFTGGTGGQQFGIPQAAPVAAPPPAPAAPVAQAIPVAPPAAIQQAPIPVPSDMDTGGFPLGAAAKTSPFQRGVQQVGTMISEEDERRTLSQQLQRQYEGQAGVGGFFMPQTAEERDQAQTIMAYLRSGSLTLPQLRELQATGKLPAPTAPTAPTATPQAGVKEPAAAEPTAPAATKPSAKVTAATKSYDNKKTPYNDLMNQAAQQYGIDPVVFKRLIGTESSFDPNAMGDVLPSGQRAIGIAQILPRTHNITEDQARDPTFAIPKAAEIFAQYLREANGDYTAALMRYKGASSEKGIAAMQEPVAIILNGTNVQGAQEIELVGKNPGQTADRVATAAAAPATSGLMFGPTEVAGGAQNPGVQSALLLRQTLASEYEIYNRNRMFGQADEALAQIAAIDLGLYKAQAEQGIYELSTSGDASRAMSVLSQFTGIPTQALSRGDGTYDLYQNGRVTQTAVPVDKLAELISTRVDDGYRQRRGELAQKMAVIGLEQGLKLKQEEMKQIGAIQTAMINGQYGLLEKQQEREGKMLVDSANEVTYQQIGGKTYAITKDTVTISGVPQTTFRRTEVR